MSDLDDVLKSYRPREQSINDVLSQYDANQSPQGWGDYARMLLRDQALNPKMDWTPLAVAAGLLHPRLGGVHRDMGMATQMAKAPGRSVYEMDIAQAPGVARQAPSVAPQSMTQMYEAYLNDILAKGGTPVSFSRFVGDMISSGRKGWRPGLTANTNEHIRLVD